MRLFSSSGRRPSPLEGWPDEQLLAAWRQKQRRACLQVIFERYAHLVHAVCCKYLDEPADREDATMDTFKVLMETPADREIDSLPNWLHGLARNTCLSYCRAREKTAVLQGEENFFEKSADPVMENGGVFTLINRELSKERPHLAELLPKALAQLDEKQRECIELFFLKDKNYKEISESTGYTFKQVKSYLQNGKRRLSTLLLDLQSGED